MESLPETDYDECGNPICNESVEPVPELIVEYAYDSLNRLIRENNYVLGKTYTYTYDTAGNILSKSTYDVTSGAVVTPTDVKEYIYSVSGWKDRLVAYGGQGISYDMVGNPWSYRGHTLEWSRIRLLTKWDSIEMEYNASGMRTRKGDTYYELDGDTIISETTCGDTIRYYYGNGGIVGFRHNGIKYYYEKNLQGDIVGIYDASGDKVGAYVYDAWGNCTITTNVGGIATVNPFRYRGYYYDVDIGLYYLKSRYYDAATGRFINADSLNYLGANRDLAAYNLFAYCSNKPIKYIDYYGNSATGLLTIGDYYIIHKTIQVQLCLTKGWKMEVPVNGSKGYGRLDLYDHENNSYYEVKSRKASENKLTTYQMEKYDVAKIVGVDAFIYKQETSATRGTELVSGSFEYGFWDVSYKLEQDGLIVYDTTYNWERFDKTVKAAVSVAIMIVFIAAAVASGGAAAGLPGIPERIVPAFGG